MRADQQGLPRTKDWTEAVDRSASLPVHGGHQPGEHLRVGIIGTGAIAAKHAAAYRNISFQITACTNHTAAKGMEFNWVWSASIVSMTQHSF